MECRNQSEILDCIIREYPKYINNGETKSLYKSVLNKCDQRLLLDMGIQDMIKRYNYCTKISTPAFKGAYDEQPAMWIDFVNILNSELSKMSE